MQGALDAGAVVVAKGTDAARDVAKVVVAHRDGRELDFAAAEACGGLAAQVHHDFEQLVVAALRLHRFGDVRRQRVQQQMNVVN